MPIVINYAPPLAALGAAAYQGGVNQRALADRQFFAQLGSTAGQAFQHGQILQQQQRQAEMQDQRTRDLAAQENQRLTQQFASNQEFQAQQQQRQQEAHLQQMLTGQQIQQDAQRLQMGLGPATWTTQDAVRHSTLTQALSQAQSDTATGMISPQLAAARVMGIQQQLAPLTQRRQAAQQADMQAQAQRTQQEWATRTFEVPGPDGLPVRMQRTQHGTFERVFDEPRGAAGAGAGARDPNALPKPTVEQIMARSQRLREDNPGMSIDASMHQAQDELHAAALATQGHLGATIERHH